MKVEEMVRAPGFSSSSGHPQVLLSIVRLLHVPTYSFDVRDLEHWTLRGINGLDALGKYCRARSDSLQMMPKSTIVIPRSVIQ